MEKYIIVTGGGFRNKGAQAMTYIAADEIAKRWPECKMLMQIGKHTKKDEETYRFGFFPGKDRFFFSTHPKQYHRIMHNTEAVIDISGYALGSDWSEKGVLYFLKTRLIDPKRYGIPVYLMPQSLGPFDFSGKLQKPVMMGLKHCLPYARIIMAREKEGENLAIQTFGLSNVITAPDLVLQNKGIHPENVFRESYRLNPIPVKPGKCAAVVPNKNNMRNSDQNDMREIYRVIIAELLRNDYTVYVLSHSDGDGPACREIKSTLFPDEENVILIDRELDCLEYGDFVSRMNFIIASRYHSIVHAYRNGVPAVVIGWAVKYQELTQMMAQTQYQFDTRQSIEKEQIRSAIDRMMNCYEAEAAVINEKLKEVQRGNVFDLVKLKSELLLSEKS